jgi:predicted amidohydrolase
VVSARVGLLQVRIDAGEPVPERIDRVLSLVRGVASGGEGSVETIAPEGIDAAARPDLLVLPELWTVGAFDADAMLANPVAVDGLLVESLQAIAREHSVWIHAGSLPERDETGRRFNTSVLIDPQGAVDAVYRKVHLFGFDEGEAVMLESGSDLVVRPTPLGATGLATCYDLRFPELFRGLLDAGAEAFLLTSGWPLSRIEHWRVLLRARAVENLAWMVACNEVGTHAGVELGGSSCVIDPWGDVVVEAPPERECLLLADVDPAAAAAARARFPVLRDRRL